MHIQTLHLQNFRRFEEKKITFHPQFNVLIGENGSGKTAILDAISIFLYGEMLSIEGINELIPKFWGSKQDIMIGKESANIEISINGNEKYIIHKNINKSLVKVTSGSFFIKKEIIDTAFKPILAYYPSARPNYFLKVDAVENEAKENEEIVEYLCYKNAFSYNYDRFKDFFKWFINEENFENSEKVRNRNFDLLNPHLQAVRHAISTFLSILMDSPLKNVRTQQTDIVGGVTYLFDVKTTVLVIDKGTTTLQIEQLSSGEQTVLLLVCDIVRRLTLANPQLHNPLDGKGIVMIDEIDIHLHPTWQRKIVEALKQTFPNIQFIVTTHSPLIIQEMKHEEIVFLDETSDYEPNLLTPDSILMRIQGLPDIETPERKEKLQELAKIDIEMQDLKKQGDEKQAEIQALWTKFREIATQLDWTF